MWAIFTWSVSSWYWWSVISICKIFLRLVTLLLPTPILEKMVTEDLAKKWAKVTIEGKTNESSKEGKHIYKSEIIVKDRRFFAKAVHDPSLAIGESYMDEWIDIPDLVGFYSAICADYDRKDPGYFMENLQEKFELSWNQQTREGSMKVIKDHYDLGNDLYLKMLDPTMNYTCAYWKEDTTTLEQAQINKMDLIARKLKLKPGMKVLDIGCGFGAAAKYLAKNYKVSVVGYTISTEQIKFARENCKGLDCEFRLEDYREATGKYDAVYSIGFFEAVGVYSFREYFEVVHRCLKDDGLHLLHTICNRDHAVPRTLKWINKYIFPGGQLPYVEDISIYSDGLFMIEDMQNMGYSYKLTLQEWHKNFVNGWPELESKYGQSMDGKFFRMWKHYLLLSQAVFNVRLLNLLQIVQSKKGVKGGYVSVR